jgi:hypothetical protein
MHLDNFLATDAGNALWVYGHSFTQDPGVACTAGQEFYKTVQSTLSAQFPSVSTYGVGNSRVVDLTHDLSGQAARTPKPGSMWDGSRTGAVIVDCAFNDAFNSTSGAVNTTSALSATQQANITDSWTAALVILASSGRVECESGTKGGTWLSDSALGRYCGGVVTRTSTNLATLTMTVTFPAAGYVWLLTHSVTTAQGGQFTVQVDGVLNVTKSAASQAVATQYDKRATAADETVFPFVTKITGTPGSHTVLITKTNNDALFLLADAILLPAASPPACYVLRDPMTTSNDGTGSWNVSGNPTNFTNCSANLALVNTCLTNAITAALHPNLTVVDPALGDSDRTPDGLHPNDTGMGKMATAVINAMSSGSGGGGSRTMMMGVG